MLTYARVSYSHTKAMLDKSVIRKVANHLGWQFEEMENAAKELYEKESIVEDWLKFFIVCLGPTNPNKRGLKVTEFLIQNLKGDLVQTICNLLYNLDPCFGVLAVFNAVDIGSIIKKSYPKGRKSFLISSVLLGEHPITMEKGIDADPRLNAYDLCHEFLNSFVLEKSEGDIDKLESLLFDVVEEADFLTFNIKAFRNLASKWSQAPHMRKKAIKLAAAIHNPFSKHHKEITEGQYWTYFALVEKLKERYGVRGAFREVGRRLGEPSSSIQRRYFEKKKEAKKERLSLEDITKIYGLQKALEELLAE